MAETDNEALMRVGTTSVARINASAATARDGLEHVRQSRVAISRSLDLLSRTRGR